jgi:hypothetical protein
MKATWMLLLASAACGGGSRTMGDGHAGRAPLERADISSVRGELSVYSDGKGHFLALVEPDPEVEVPAELRLFYGDGKTFHAAQVGNAHADGMKFEIGFQDPRIPSSPAGTVKRELGKVTLTCYGTDVELTRLPAPEAQAMVGDGTFHGNATRFSPLALARQGDRYLYVDSARGEDPTYRVFAGKPGAMKPIPVQSASYDQRANVFTFVTRDGTLKAERDRDAREVAFGLAWEGKEAWETMGRAESWRLIFEELGVYPTRTPTPCDPMMP